jgi:CheY-like chemotaxis protein
MNSMNGFGYQHYRQMRTLLVDSGNSVRDSLYTLLENDGHEVLAASDGQGALAILKRSVRPIDLLVTDYNIPGMTGLDLARACARRNRDMAVLYLSVSQPDTELQEDLATRRRAFLAKPFRRSELIRKTRELLVPGFAPVAISGLPTLQLAIQKGSRAASGENS